METTVHNVDAVKDVIRLLIHGVSKSNDPQNSTLLAEQGSRPFYLSFYLILRLKNLSQSGCDYVNMSVVRRVLLG